MDFHTKTDRVINDNAFKEEVISSSPMKNNTRKEKTQCNALHTLHTLHEKNDQIQIRMRKSLHQNFMRYCALSGMTAGNFYEQAGILFMDLNPIDGIVLVVEKLDSSNSFDVEDKMTELICIGDLEDWISERKQSIEFGGDGEIHQSKIKKLRGIISECKKINKRSEQLNSLISEALEYVC